MDADGLYDRLAGLGFDYGPAFQGVTRVWRRGDEVYAAVSLDDEQASAAGEYAVHPALFDAAFHAAIDALSADAEPGRVPLPFAFSGRRGRPARRSHIARDRDLARQRHDRTARQRRAGPPGPGREVADGAARRSRRPARPRSRAPAARPALAGGSRRIAAVRRARRPCDRGGRALRRDRGAAREPTGDGAHRSSPPEKRMPPCTPPSRCCANGGRTTRWPPHGSCSSRAAPSASRPT